MKKGDRYDVSMKAGERTLLPKVRAVSESTLIVSNGFSCRETELPDNQSPSDAPGGSASDGRPRGPDGPHAGLPETNYVQPVANALSNKEKAIVAAPADCWWPEVFSCTGSSPPSVQGVTGGGAGCPER